MKITPIILSGGSGTRLWPISRKKLPKQFVKLVDDETPFSKALELVSDSYIFEPAIIVTNSEHRFLVAEEILQNDCKNNSILLEPSCLNTCPAIAAASFFADKNSVLLVLPSDHLIQQPENFIEAIKNCYEFAEAGNIVTFGIKPSAPATGYGYIKTGAKINSNACKVETFTEKPNIRTALEYLNSGNYLWNSGIYMFKADNFLELLNQHEPEIYQNVQSSVLNATKDYDFIRLEAEKFNLCKNISVDYAIIEKVKNLVVAPVECGWQDLGDFQALSDANKSNQHGNNIIGDVVAKQTTNSYLHSDNGLLVAVGLQNIIAYKAKDVTLIADKSQSQNIKAIVEDLKNLGRNEFENSAKQHRPWGFFEDIENGDDYKIKILNIKPNAKISMQMHKNRAEHWVVISGTAKVLCDGKEFLLKANQSTYIPIGSTHRLENIGTTPLIIIEVQTGEILSEDDIQRFEDDYGRV
jgi:mannose-1-phosphate guanylyltransferase/mannose-6-phosphate isomerase